jgi:hypothetical protein
MAYRDPKKETARLKGDLHATKCKLIDAEKSGDFARIVSAKRRMRLAEEAYADFSSEARGKK